MADIKFDKRNSSEKWVDVRGYEGLYVVSSKGNVFSLRTNKVLKQHKDVYGYARVCLQRTNRKDVRHFYVHRLVAENFLEKVEGKSFVNHKDENKLNNCVENLEWCTHVENMNYGTRNARIGKSNLNSVYFSKKVKDVTHGIVYCSMKEAQRQTGVFVSNISKCCNGLRRKAGGCKWELV